MTWINQYCYEINSPKYIYLLKATSKYQNILINGNRSHDSKMYIKFPN